MKCTPQRIFSTPRRCEISPPRTMTMNERRLHGRRRTFKGGKLIFNKGLSVLDCIIRDLSDDGARLELTTTATIPDQFDDHHRTRPD